ncbi:PEP-CTERM sorting domain-containing protein [Dechloromonas sp. A34]|uniref:PEP-CTERM sorting domain-containing protein n=1 Tax=Dechloromonas sp. A34 TaxID=447588 RepID=UPI002248A317|nr:PEP-CTERM sorting domain-containing protein [Dechloromonas sp. A34]
MHLNPLSDRDWFAYWSLPGLGFAFAGFGFGKFYGTRCVIRALYPQKFREGSDGRSDSVKAIAAINASPASAGMANPMTGSQQGVGAAVMQLAQALHLAGNPGLEALARPSSINEFAPDTGKPPRSPTRDNRELVRKYLCAMAQANTPGAAFDRELCEDIPTPNDFQIVATGPGITVNPSLDQRPPSSNQANSDRETGELIEDLQRALLLATLPVDLGPNSDRAGGVPTGLPIQSSSPDLATDFAAFPSALVIDELAATVPEPATLALLALGLAGLGAKRKRTA